MIGITSTSVAAALTATKVVLSSTHKSILYARQSKSLDDDFWRGWSRSKSPSEITACANIKPHHHGLWIAKLLAHGLIADKGQNERRIVLDVQETTKDDCMEVITRITFRSF